MHIFYIVFFSVVFLLLFLCLAFYAIAAVKTLFEDDEEEKPVFAIFLGLVFIGLFGWLLWDGYWYIISMGP